MTTERQVTTPELDYWFVPAHPTDLPAPHDMEHPPCMVDPAARYAPRGRFVPRTCCWYHQGSWEEASQTAIALTLAAQTDGVPAGAIEEHVLSAAEDQGISGWVMDAIETLFWSPIRLDGDPDDPDDLYEDGTVLLFEGRHRVTAMLDQGVRQTLIAHLEYIDPATGRPLDTT
jgi:hypothetical protein